MKTPGGEEPVIQPPESTPDIQATLTWSVLLARWTEFARSAVAFPKDAAGDRWRASVAPAIGLQAVALALSETARLHPAERALALDLAEILIQRHARELHEAWRGETLHPELDSLVADARAALASARHAGTEWLVEAPHFVAPDPIEFARRLLAAGFDGDLLAPLPGAVLFRGVPAAYFRPAPPLPPPEGLRAALTPGPRQIYRQADPETGLAAGDLVAPLLEALPPGRPLLVPILERGELVASYTAAEANAWRDLQARILPPEGLSVAVWAPED